MDDARRVRRRHRVADAGEEGEAGRDGEALRVAPDVDRASAHELHHVERHAVVGHAAVEQARDPRVIESREDLPLGVEAAHERLVAMEPALEELERDAHAEGAVVAHRLVHRPHPSLAGGAQQAPRADARRGARCGARRLGIVVAGKARLRHERSGPHGRRPIAGGGERAVGIVRVEQAEHLGVQRRIAVAGAGDVCGARTARQLECGVEHRVDAGPALGRHRLRHRAASAGGVSGPARRGRAGRARRAATRVPSPSRDAPCAR